MFFGVGSAILTGYNITGTAQGHNAIVSLSLALQALLGASDYVSMHVPYIKGVTHHLLDAEKLRLLKPTCNILNFSRGELIDSEALLCEHEHARPTVLLSPPLSAQKALCSPPRLAEGCCRQCRHRGEGALSRRVAALSAGVSKLYNGGHRGNYILDFPDKVLHGHPRVVEVPHLGASTEEVRNSSALSWPKAGFGASAA